MALINVAMSLFMFILPRDGCGQAGSRFGRWVGQGVFDGHTQAFTPRLREENPGREEKSRGAETFYWRTEGLVESCESGNRGKQLGWRTASGKVISYQ